MSPVYIAEAGDRVWGKRTSPIFVLAAVCVQERHAADLDAALAGLRQDLGRPPDTVLRWSRNLKGEDRVLAARALVVPRLILTSVVVRKRRLHQSNPSAPHPGVLYADALLRLFERAGGPRNCTFTAVRGYRPREIDAAIGLGQVRPSKTWYGEVGPIHIATPRTEPRLQAAGIVAGALYSAFAHGEPAALNALAPRFSNGYGAGQVRNWAVVIVGPDGSLAYDHPWWPDTEERIEWRRPA